jgi:hypothetical protein
MLSNIDYLMAWSIYLLGAAALLITVWRLTSWMWGWVKDPLRVMSAVLLLTPASVDGDPAHLAPNLIIVGFELLTAENGGLGPLLGVRLLLILIFAVLAVWLLRLLWYWLVGGRQRRARPASAAPAHGRAADR